MQPGDDVEVTNLDGETAEGEIVAMTHTTLENAAADWWDDDRTLWDYWRGTDNVQPTDRVITVRLGDQVYDYPETRVDVITDA
jgi:hypothetical protein